MFKKYRAQCSSTPLHGGVINIQAYGRAPKAPNQKEMCNAVLLIYCRRGVKGNETV